MGQQHHALQCVPLLALLLRPCAQFADPRVATGIAFGINDVNVPWYSGRKVEAVLDKTFQVFDAQIARLYRLGGGFERGPSPTSMIFC